MGNGQTLPETGKRISAKDVKDLTDINREYRNISSGGKRVSVKAFESYVKNQNKRESKNLDVGMIKTLFSDKKDIEFMDFLRWKMEVMQGGDGQELRKVLTEVFKEIDDGDGFLTPTELVTVEAKLGKAITEREAETIIEEWDHDGDGKMDVDNFLNYKFATLN